MILNRPPRETYQNVINTEKWPWLYMSEPGPVMGGAVVLIKVGEVLLAFRARGHRVIHLI